MMTKKEREEIRDICKIETVIRLLDALDEMEAAYNAVNENLKLHLEKNHGCENCPHESGWCASAKMKKECSRLLAEDRDRWKKRAEALEEAIRWREICNVCSRHYMCCNECIGFVFDEEMIKNEMQKGEKADE